MSAFRIIEEDHGTYTRGPHPHNGYYAGDFSALSTRPDASPVPTAVLRTSAHPSEWMVA